MATGTATGSLQETGCLRFGTLTHVLTAWLPITTAPTLTRAKQLCCPDNISSPVFPRINEYGDRYALVQALFRFRLDGNRWESFFSPLSQGMVEGWTGSRAGSALRAHPTQ